MRMLSPPVTPMIRLARLCRHAKLRRQIGFTLVEVLAALIIVVLLAAVVLPTVMKRIDDANVRREANDLATFAQAIMTYHDHVGMWPSSLLQLVVAPVAGATNICGNAHAAKDVARWKGPYVTTEIPATGIVIDTDTIEAALAQIAGTPTVLQITLKNPSLATDTTIQDLLDSDIVSTTGRIRWTVSPSRLTYNLPITGC